MKKNNSLIVLTPKNKFSDRDELTFRLDGKSDDYLNGFEDALKEVMVNFNVYCERV